jgi:hypothetical protein
MYKEVAELNEQQTAKGKILVTAALFTHFGKWNASVRWYVDDCMGVNWNNNFRMWAHYHESLLEAAVDPAAALIEPLTLDPAVSPIDTLTRKHEVYFQAKDESVTHVFYCYGIWAGVLVEGKIVKEGYSNPFVPPA